MTIAAAYLLDGRPVLFADMMLSRPKTPGEMAGITPNQPYAFAVLAERGRAWGGATRKALRINRHLAMAWAGNFHSAKRVIEKLRANFTHHAATLETLADVLSEISDIPPDYYCEFVGWLAGTPPTAIHWDSRCPAVVDQGDSFKIGSGVEIFEAHHAEPWVKAQTGLSGEGLVEYKLALAAGAFLMRDWTDNSTTQNEFGCWYESLLLSDDGVFVYTDDIQFSSWSFDFDPDGRPLLVARPTIVVQSRSKARFAVVQTRLLDTSAIYVSVLSDGTDNLKNVNSEKELIKSVARHQCWAFTIRFPGLPQATIMFVSDGSSAVAKAVMIRGKMHLQVDCAEILKIAKANVPSLLPHRALGRA